MCTRAKRTRERADLYEDCTQDPVLDFVGVLL